MFPSFNKSNNVSISLGKFFVTTSPFESVLNSALSNDVFKPSIFVIRLIY